MSHQHGSSAPYQLQWGRGGEAAESTATVSPIPVSSSLQWGRGGEAAESGGSIALFEHGEVLQWGRGGEAAESAGRGAAGIRHAAGFNGAAAVRPRKGCCGWQQHVILTGFNGAAAVRPRKGKANRRVD